jgi:hypothetical protein
MSDYEFPQQIGEYKLQPSLYEPGVYMINPGDEIAIVHHPNLYPIGSGYCVKVWTARKGWEFLSHGYFVTFDEARKALESFRRINPDTHSHLN